MYKRLEWSKSGEQNKTGETEVVKYSILHNINYSANMINESNGERPRTTLRFYFR